MYIKGLLWFYSPYFTFWWKIVLYHCEPNSTYFLGLDLLQVSWKHKGLGENVTLTINEAQVVVMYREEKIIWVNVEFKIGWRSRECMGACGGLLLHKQNDMNTLMSDLCQTHCKHIILIDDLTRWLQKQTLRGSSTCGGLTLVDSTSLLTSVLISHSYLVCISGSRMSAWILY